MTRWLQLITHAGLQHFGSALYDSIFVLVTRLMTQEIAFWETKLMSFSFKLRMSKNIKSLHMQDRRCLQSLFGYSQKIFSLKWSCKGENDLRRMCSIILCTVSLTSSKFDCQFMNTNQTKIHKPRIVQNKKKTFQSDQRKLKVEGKKLAQWSAK